jgi:transposase
VPMLEGKVDAVIGVDTHRDAHAAAILDRNGGLIAELAVPSNQAGYEQRLDFIAERALGRRCWALEGTGCYGAGLTSFLLDHGEWVTEIDRPKRSGRTQAKSDALDAVRAAREALSREHLATPRARGEREAMRVLLATRRSAVAARTEAINQLKALIVGAPEQLRARLRHGCTDEQLRRCVRLRLDGSAPAEQQATVWALRAAARRVRLLEREAAEHERRLRKLVLASVPVLLDELGVGVIVAAQVLVSWSHPGRVRSEAAFAMLAGAAPVPASSGQVVRHRLNRSGDRQLNRALHTIVLVRLRLDPRTRRYAARRRAEGKSDREIRRCLKRTIARQLFRLLRRSSVNPASCQGLDGT